MTPQERAEKIVTRFNGEGACLPNTDETYLQELIAAQIEEAQAEIDSHYAGWVKEIYAEDFRAGQESKIEPSRETPACGHTDDCSCYRDKFYMQGFNAAREKAKGICEDHWSTPDSEIAKRIGEMSIEDCGCKGVGLPHIHSDKPSREQK